MNEPILTRRFHLPNSHTIKVYEETGGYQAVRKALRDMTPAQVVEDVKKSGLRGRGGAGFPAGMKWGFVPKNTGKPVYLCVNADESEPGTFKDRHLLEKDPHLVIEGAMIAAYAIESHQAYIYIRGEYIPQAKILGDAIREAYERGYLGRNIFNLGYDLELSLYRGAGAYICGEETGLLESLEGKKGYPRLKPPFPAAVGLHNCPTIINNVETLANVPAIIANGGVWYAGLGTPKDPGTRLFGVSGHVCKPGLFERPIGYPLKKLIFEDAGGILDGLNLKAVIPGGSSVPVLRADEIDIPLDSESLAAAGSMLGSAGVIVMHEKTCMVRALQRLAHFYWEESCGQCSPCREGTGWLLKILNRILADQGRSEDVAVLPDVADGIMGNTICPLGDAAAMPVLSFVRKFKEEFIYHIEHRRCDVDGR